MPLPERDQRSASQLTELINTAFLIAIYLLSEASDYAAARLIWGENSEGAPTKNQIAIKLSKIRHPKEEVGMKGQIGLPHK